jgi:hypothetical protein
MSRWYKKDFLPPVIILQSKSCHETSIAFNYLNSPKPRTHTTIKMPSPFGAPPKAASLLDFHRVMAPTAGVRVSPLCLGAMNFGDAWEEMMGKCDKKTVFEILDFFHQQGGNFIDT